MWISQNTGARRPPHILIMVMFSFLLAGIPSFAQQVEDLPTRNIESGDFCIVGDETHDHLDRVFLYKGRWVGVCPPHAEVLLNSDSLAYYFARLQPKGALYQEDAVQGADRPIRLGWFIFGVWVAVALVAGAVAANISLKKGLPAIRGFFIGLFGSILGLIYVMMQPAKETVELPSRLAKIPTTAAPNICPECNGQNHPSAKKCSNCGHELSPEIESELHRL